MGIFFDSVPIGSVASLSTEQRIVYLSAILSLPIEVATILFKPETGAFVRGLVKNYNLSDTAAVILALTIVRLFIGEIEASGLSARLSSELSIEKSQADAIASEIQKDTLYAVTKTTTWRPTMEQKTSATVTSDNVLDLTKQAKPPSPPPLT